MRGVKSLVALVVVAAGLAAYIYFVESKRPAGEEAALTKAKAFTVAADKVNELAVRASSGERTLLRKSGATWEMVEPEKLAADQAEASGLASSLASLEIQRVVEEKAADLKAYGLAEPSIEVAFKAEGDKEPRRLLVGDKTATGGDLYAKLGSEPKVFLISSYLETTFRKTAFDLRDKTALAFDRAAASAIEVVTPEKRLRLVKAGDQWRLAEPVEARTDFGSVEGLVSRLQTTQMKSIVVREPKDLKEYGLDKPALVATISAGSARATLEIGKAADGGALYARDLSRPMVFTVESALADDLKKPADDYRRKDLFEFRSYNATRLEFTRDKATQVFEKFSAKTEDGKGTADKWRMVQPERREVDTASMETLLSKLSNLRAQSFTDPAAKTKTGLEAPVGSVLVAFDDGKQQERVTFGKVDADLFASRPGEADASKLFSSDWDDVVKALEEAARKMEPKAEPKQDAKPK